MTYVKYLNWIHIFENNIESDTLRRIGFLVFNKGVNP